MSAIKNHDLEAHEKLTARVYVQPSGESGYIDLGNVNDYSNAESREYRTRAAAERGFRYVNDEQVDVVHQMYQFTLDERSEYAERLLALAESVTTVDQGAATGSTTTLTDVTPGRSYFLSVRPVSNVVVELNGNPLAEGTDYEIDLNSGRLTVLEDGAVETGDDLEVEYNVIARGYQQWTAREQPLFRGPARIEEYNQLSREPLRTITGNAVFSVTTFPEQSGEFGTYQVRLTFTDKPVITKRYNADSPGPNSAS